MAPVTEAERQSQLVDEFADTSLGECYGIQQWGDPAEDPLLQPVLNDFLLPEIPRRSRFCEIGSGGGRWSRYFIKTGKPTLLVDGSPASETLIKALPELSAVNWDQVQFLVALDGNVPISHCNRYDYVFSFDTFVHFELSLVLTYLQAISHMLKPGGVMHLHYADALSSTWFADLDNWDGACRSFHYVGREEMTAILSKFGFIMTPRELTFGANGSRLIECVRRPNI